MRRLERTYGLWFLAFLGSGNREDSPGVGAARGDQVPPVAPALNLSLMLRSDFDNRIGSRLWSPLGPPVQELQVQPFDQLL
jgi:hypothetical protein